MRAIKAAAVQAAPVYLESMRQSQSNLVDDGKTCRHDPQQDPA